VKYFRDVPNPLMKSIQSEATFGQLLARPCGPHYRVYDFAYKPYIKSQGHRAVCTELFLTVGELDSYLANVATKADQVNALEDFKVLKNCMAGALVRLEKIKNTKSKELYDVHQCNFVVQVDGAMDELPMETGFSRITHKGVLYNHGVITVDKNMSTCWEPNRKGAVLCETVLSLNQALGCYDEVKLLLYGVQTTADLLFILRQHRPTLFYDDATFSQMAAVSQSAPFSLGLDLFSGATICGVGTINQDMLPVISGVQGALRMHLVLRGKLLAGD
jgi:hypothetical protein